MAYHEYNHMCYKYNNPYPVSQPNNEVISPRFGFHAMSASLVPN